MGATTMRTVAHTLFRVGVTLLGLWLGGAQSTLAADVPVAVSPAPEEPLPVPTGWELRLTPYAWGPSLNGKQTVRGRTVDVDITFVDLVRKILEHGDTLLGAMANVEARNGPFGLYADGVYMLVRASAASPGHG